MTSARPDHAVVVTGAASGIGRATGQLFEARGFGVVALDLEAPDWCNGERSVALAGDASTEASNAEMVDVAVRHFGHLQAAVLNAGITGSLPFEVDEAMDRFDDLVAVNLRGVALGIRHTVPAIRSTTGRGAVVVTASTSGFGGDPGNWAYNATKAGVINMVRAAAVDYGAQGIRINAVAPGPVETGMTAGLARLPALHEGLRRRIALQRWGQPDELAEAIWFLASPAASFITGVALPVDGGLSASAGHFDLPVLAGRGDAASATSDRGRD